MIMYEQDPDIVRWGLNQLLDLCSLSNAGSLGPVIQYDTDVGRTEYVREGYCEREEHKTVENDEFIAHALQEELSQPSIPEASGSENMQASILYQELVGPSIAYDNYGNNNGDEDRDGIGVSTSCSIPREESHDGQVWSYLPEIKDESPLDGEVGKRLNQLVPVPHVPKINGEIPTVDEETSDYQRLLNRLQLYDLVELQVQGDGNCQFRALSDQFYRTPEHHEFVRQQIVNQLKSYPEMYEGYVPKGYADYLEDISKNGEWGDHVTLQAAADSYGVKIFVITSFKDTCYIEILPSIQKSNRLICLSFWAEVHYNSIYPEGEQPELDNKKKKKWWMF